MRHSTGIRLLQEHGGQSLNYPKRPLFWTEKYWDLASDESATATESTVYKSAEIFFQRANGLIRVPGAATFGGWWPTDGTLWKTDQYFAAYEWFFEHNPVNVFEIRLPPEYFHPSVFLPQAEALRILGAKVTVDSVQIFPGLGGLGSDVVSSLPKGERWWIRKFLKEGGDVRPAQPHEYASAYEIIRLNKERRGAGTSISRAKFLVLLEKNPHTYRCWLATFEGETCGAALTVDIDLETTYVFYWADTPGGRKRSVVTAIFAEILEDAKNRGKSMVDLGLSSFLGVVDEGLFSFKKHLGAKAVAQCFFRIERLQ